MHTLAAESDYRFLASRLAAVTPQDTPRWGRMNAYQMLRHVADAIRVPFGELEVSEHTGLLWQTVMKWAALWYPRPWPHNAATRPELDACALGITQGDFEAARQDALTQLDRLHRARFDSARHPFFGDLTHKEWMRWGWLHNDHHLRQFGR
ncbi:MAG TPA: DUF1569 domain-containing protein [Acidobacteriaceae bacterium]|nr:DUF1569 domain-containing protein [Acidobacteriaceae bacterium]